MRHLASWGKPIYQLMKHPDFLDNRDFTGEDKKRPSTMSMDTSYQALEGVV